jgi:crotonobetainyl-CoA:carnitine CoA-transferase CaiB-like acyl-CoA transferase
MNLPLEGVRVLDSTYVVAMPYTCGILADLGADVIKIEGPSHLDGTRGLALPEGPDNDGSGDYWNKKAGFTTMNRGKRSLSLDMGRQEGRDLFIEMIKVSDIIVENFTPRVMKKWNLTYEDIKKIKPDIIMISNTGYGHSEGPYASYPGQATTMEATHGTASVTGYYGELPNKAGRSYVDFLASWHALFAVASALRYRNRTGKGQWIDIGMYQLGVSFISEYLMDWIGNRRLPSRIGNRHPQYAPQGCYRTNEYDRWITISIVNTNQWKNLCEIMQRNDLFSDPRFIDNQSRIVNHDDLDTIISSFTKNFDRFELTERLQQSGIPSGPVFDVKDASLSKHNWERGFLEKVTGPPERGIGPRVLIARPWHLNKSNIKIKGYGPAFGDANFDILKNLLAKSDNTIKDLTDMDIVNDVPTRIRQGNVSTGREGGTQTIGNGWFDKDYKKNLGIE